MEVKNWASAWRPLSRACVRDQNHRGPGPRESAPAHQQERPEKSPLPPPTGRIAPSLGPYCESVAEVAFFTIRETSSFCEASQTNAYGLQSRNFAIQLRLHFALKLIKSLCRVKRGPVVRTWLARPQAPSAKSSQRGGGVKAIFSSITPFGRFCVAPPQLSQKK